MCPLYEWRVTLAASVSFCASTAELTAPQRMNAQRHQALGIHDHAPVVVPFPIR
ncbi:hypothetical protein BIFGAL_03624 [Bifidobacterium gallicum DSM 20093 = LMG 11596]|uniref:Uncharacterized protein n=1 Tax=Bifidobacterium gallicum DSM 20093 = LMG 11596 TaxID=561180 RepID=D1NUU8_9BIFI|nr:hypothetical protein BIFGAL_03624 [Bifidobacterium gallicum DSM 20093 = LMG 11596]